MFFSIAVQLLLSAENMGEVYIKSTESGQYLAMDANGRLYGSVSMRFLWVLRFAEILWPLSNKAHQQQLDAVCYFCSWMAILGIGLFLEK